MSARLQKLQAACEVRTKYGLDHPPSCICKQPPPQPPTPAQSKMLAASHPSAPGKPIKVAIAQPRSAGATGTSGRCTAPKSFNDARSRNTQPTPSSAAPTQVRQPQTPRMPPPPPPKSMASSAVSVATPATPMGPPGMACAALSETLGDHCRQGLLQQRSRFTVVLRDAHGVRLRRGGDKVRAASRGPGPLRPSVFDEGDGSYTVSYLATVSGTYSLSLSCNAVPLPNSPLEISVEPSIAHAPSCLADGDGLRVAVAGESTSFFVRAHDEFGRPKIMGGELFEAYAKPVDAAHLPSSASPLAHSPSRTPLTAALSPRPSSSPQPPPPSLLSHGEAAPSSVPIPLADLGNGSYEGRYALRCAGRYQLHVEREGVAIGGSPFTLRVIPAPSDAATCALSGDGVRYAEAGQPARFTLLPRDRFGNSRRPAALIKSNGLPSDDAFEATLVPLRAEHQTAALKCKVAPSADGIGYDIKCAAPPSFHQTT